MKELSGESTRLIVGGGSATDGTSRILDITPTSLHQRTPLYIGSKGDVAEVHRLLGTAEPSTVPTSPAASENGSPS